MATKWHSSRMSWLRSLFLQKRWCWDKWKRERLNLIKDYTEPDISLPLIILPHKFLFLFHSSLFRQVTIISNLFAITGRWSFRDLKLSISNNPKIRMINLCKTFSLDSVVILRPLILIIRTNEKDVPDPDSERIVKAEILLSIQFRFFILIINLQLDNIMASKSNIFES